MIDLSLFRHSHPIEVRFGDCDSMRHVNNAKYFTYFETSRIIYMRDVVEKYRAEGGPDMILARTECDFKTPLKFGDMAMVHCRVVRLGNSSFDFEYVLVREGDQAISAVAKSVQVVYDYDVEKPVPIPDDWRRRFINYEPALQR